MCTTLALPSPVPFMMCIGTVSVEAQTAKQTVTTRNPAAAKSGASFGTDPVRCLAILYVKIHVNGNLLASSLVASEGMRLFFSLAFIPHFPRSLNPTQIEAHVTEIYAATISKLRQSLAMVTMGARGPMPHADSHPRMSRTSHEEYLAESSSSCVRWTMCVDEE